MPPQGASPPRAAPVPRKAGSPGRNSPRYQQASHRGGRRLLVVRPPEPAVPGCLRRVLLRRRSFNGACGPQGGASPYRDVHTELPPTLSPRPGALSLGSPTSRHAASRCQVSGRDPSRRPDRRTTVRAVATAESVCGTGSCPRPPPQPVAPRCRGRRHRRVRRAGRTGAAVLRSGCGPPRSAAAGPQADGRWWLCDRFPRSRRLGARGSLAGRA